MRVLFILAVVLNLLFVHCKSEKKSRVDKPSSEILEKLDIPAPALAEADDAFKALAMKNSPNPDIEQGIWHYTYGLSIKEEAPKNNLFEGQWIDLMPGGQYTKGLYADTTEYGFFTFDDNTKVIQLRATNKKASSEWKLMVDPDHMVWVGTATYGNNPWQIKFSRKFEIPTKK